jgi:predicted pyridoxine 5'-phosphate oxidase superfamily flavin-nucleotide-binding protein
MPMYERITPAQADLLRNAQVFFVASVTPDLAPGPSGEGAVNVSPKGGVPLHVLDDHHVAYLDFPGSGNETARHAGAAGPITLMAMSMSATDAAIVRLYGHATITPVAELPADNPLLDAPDATLKHPRQVVTITVEATQTSCGYGVPVFEFVSQRPKAGRGRRYKE